MSTRVPSGSINTRRCRRAATGGASSPPSPTPARVCGACRCSIVWPTNATRNPTCCRSRPAWRSPRASAKASLFYLSARGTGDGLWKVQEGKAIGRSTEGVDGALSEPPAVSPDGLRLAVVVRSEGKRHLSIMSADGTSARTLRASIEIEGAAGQGAADWSPDGTRIVAGGRDEKGPGLFVDLRGYRCTRPAPRGHVGQSRVVAARGSDRVCRAGPHRSGRAPRRCDPMARRSSCRTCSVRPGGYRFLPDGTGLVYLARIPSLDFWLLRLRDGQVAVQLTRLANQGRLRTFDITPDGKSIVFDRSRQNSNIVLIELPK